MSCAAPVKPHPEKDKAVSKPLESIEKKEEPLSKPAVIQVLSTEADKFFLQGNFKDALSIYDQLLPKLKEDQKLEIISKMESVLAKTPTRDLEEWIEIKETHIPKALLLYYLGLNHALENNPEKSMENLEIFISEYPDHYHYYEALDLLETVKKSLFNPDTIGCLLPLSGKYAVFGQRALTGIQLAVQELSKKYSREFKVILIDTQADPEMTVQGVKTLQEKNVAGIIGPFLMEAEAGKEAEKFKIPLIAFTQKHDFPLQGDYLFANFITPEMQVQSLCNYIFADLGIKKVAILYPDEKYGIRYMELFRDIALEYEAEIVGIESYDGKKTDFTVPIRKITKEFLLASESITPAVSNSEDVNNPDENPYSDGEEDETSLPKRKISTAKTTVDFQALFIPDSPSRINLILPQLSFNDAGGMYLIGTNLWHDEGLLKGIKGYNKKLIIPDGFLDNSQNPITEEFTQKFEALFHHKPQFLEAIAYDTASILFITAMDETVDSRKALRDALRGKRIYEGVTGPTLFDEQGRAHRPLFLITVKNGEFVEITP
jgi:ABC-type branched-subunit amino acid transport system substrate-binding protein